MLPQDYYATVRIDIYTYIYIYYCCAFGYQLTIHVPLHYDNVTLSPCSSWKPDDDHQQLYNANAVQHHSQQRHRPIHHSTQAHTSQRVIHMQRRQQRIRCYDHDCDGWQYNHMCMYSGNAEWSADN